MSLTYSYCSLSITGLNARLCFNATRDRSGLRLGEKFLNLRSSILSRAMYFLGGARDDAHDAGKRFLANALHCQGCSKAA